MKDENALKMQLEPFLALRCNLEELYRASDSEMVCMLNLLTLYYAKMLDSEAVSEFKIKDTTAVWESYRSSSGNHVYVEKYLKDLFELILTTLHEWSSFQFEEINLERVEQVACIPWTKMVELKRSEKRRLISDYLKASGDVRTRKLFRTFQKVFVDSLDYSYRRRVIVFSSERVLKYLNFAAEHPDEISNKFAEEHAKIYRALQVIRRPLDDEDMEGVIASKQAYMIATYYGTSSGKSLSLGHLNWNFFVAMYVLERLLDLADSLFDFKEVL